MPPAPDADGASQGVNGLQTPLNNEQGSVQRFLASRFNSGEFGSFFQSNRAERVDGSADLFVVDFCPVDLFWDPVRNSLANRDEIGAGRTQQHRVSTLVRQKLKPDGVIYEADRAEPLGESRALGGERSVEQRKGAD